ncbi:hypothetical protein K2X33_03370 [bacterium]|nr:hypothetical protein [bacterium]
MSDLVRLNISKEADICIRRMLPKVNKDPFSGTVNRSQLVSWIVLNFEFQLTKFLPRIQRDHFDNIAYLQSLVAKEKEAKKGGQSCAEFERIALLLRQERKLRGGEVPTISAKSEHENE